MVENPDQHMSLCQQLCQNCHEILRSDKVIGGNTNEATQIRRDLFAATLPTTVPANATPRNGDSKRKVLLHGRKVLI